MMNSCFHRISLIFVGVVIFALSALSCLDNIDKKERPAILSGYVACINSYYLHQYDQLPHRKQIGLMTADKCFPTERINKFDFIVMETGQVSNIRLLLPDGHYSDVSLHNEAISLNRNDEVYY